MTSSSSSSSASPGEARPIEQVEREEELNDFVSTSKGVLQSLMEKHFPAPVRDKITAKITLWTSSLTSSGDPVWCPR